MKKFFYYAAALAALVSASACQREALVDDTQAEEVEVTFTISTESAISTKSIGYADTYEKELQLYVYKDGVLLDQLVPEIEDFDGVGDLDARATVRLVKGQDYDFVFWAQAEGKNYYSINPAYPPSVTVDYNGLNANEENRDAFYDVIEDFHVSAGMLPQNVTLRRPFAQINVGTTQEDIDAAKVAGVVIDKTSVTLSNVANEFNFFERTAEGSVEVNFQSALIPAQDLVVYSNKDYPTEHLYYYLSMNYILVADQTPGAKDVLEDYKITFWQGTREINTISVPNVPVRRNWRTNIIGESLLTDYASFIITIDPHFYGEYDYTYPGGNVEEVPYDQTTTPVDNNLYLKPNSNWTVDNARFAVYSWGGAEKWIDMTDTDGDGIYEISKDDLEGNTNIIFCRMNPDNAANDWSNKWNQTGDLIVPTDGTNLYTVASGTWDNGGGTWSVK